MSILRNACVARSILRVDFLGYTRDLYYGCRPLKDASVSGLYDNDMAVISS